MKKCKAYKINRCIVALLAVVLLATLPACEAPEDAKITDQTAKAERVKLATFKKSLGELLGETGIYKMTMANSTESDDGSIMYVFDITHDLVYSQERMMLFVSCDNSGAVASVSCFADDGASSNVSIALISYYTYKSLGLSDLDADAFYDAFAFFEDEPAEEYEKEENGWLMEVWYKEDGASFHAFQLGA